MYACLFCGYSSDKKNNYLRHIKTKRHFDNLNKTFECDKSEYYHCIMCSYKNKKKNQYLRHINFCVMKNLNKAIQLDSKDHVNQLQKKFKSEIRSINSINKNIQKENILCLKVLSNLIKENYINERVLNDKNIWSISEKKKILQHLHENEKGQGKDQEEVILKDIENQLHNNITTIYLNDFDNKHINNIENVNDNISVYSNSEININEYTNNSCSDCNSESDSDSDSDSDSEILDIHYNMQSLKKIRDCGRIFFYDQNNVVFNLENNVIGTRVHDDSCPKNHKNNKYTDRCWWYVDYEKSNS